MRKERITGQNGELKNGREEFRMSEENFMTEEARKEKNVIKKYIGAVGVTHIVDQKSVQVPTKATCRIIDVLEEIIG